MKILSRYLALITVSALALAPSLIRAQDAPPPPDQGVPPPPDQGAPPPPDQGDQSQSDQSDDQGASFQTFYDQLGSQGNWIQTDNYGYVFQPAVTDPNWAPYSDGHWVYTDAGWAWMSDEPWGWATYHYGRWANIDGTGWVWVPGYRWAPAWVSWRYGGGYCGWAPLPPETFIGAEYGGGGVGIGFSFGGDVDVRFNIGPGCYNFVNVGDMGYDNYRGHYLDHSRNYTVINNTTNITNISVYNEGNPRARQSFSGVTTGGPVLADVNSHVHTPFQTVHLAAAGHAGMGSLQGNTLAVYAPRVNAASLHTARPTTVARTIAHPTFNRGTSITKPLAVNEHLKPAAPSEEAIAAAKEARANAPASARIGTGKTKTPTFSKPLTSMQPVSQVKRTTSAATPAERTPSAEHATSGSPFTGESEKPATTYHPENEVKPATTYHPENEVKPATAYHPETEVKPTTTYHPQEEKPATQVYHPQAEEKPAPTYHPQAEQQHESAPAPTYHPQAEPQHESTPAPSYHPQVEPQHESVPSHPQAPPAKPAPSSSGNGNKGSGDKDKDQQQH